MTETVGTLDYNEIVFPRLGIDIHVNSTAFTIGSLSIQWYGILITLGIVLAVIYAFTQVRKYGLHPDGVLDAIIGGLIGAIVGARAYYVILNWDKYADDWKSVFYIREGGLAIYGGIIGALVVGCIVAKLRHVKILPLLDITGICFLLGQGIGRWGNFFNQEAFGSNTTSIFGMSGGRIQSWIDNSYTATSYYQNFGASLDSSLPVHPCFLYESIWCLLGFVLLAIFAKKIRRFDGQIFLMYIGWYGLERAVVESLRTDSLVVGNVRISQLIAILCVVVAVVLLIVIGSRVHRLGGDYQMYKDTIASRTMMERLDNEAADRRAKRKGGAPTKEKTDTTTSTSSDNTEKPLENSTSQDTPEQDNILKKKDDSPTDNPPEKS